MPSYEETLQQLFGQCSAPPGFTGEHADQTEGSFALFSIGIDRVGIQQRISVSNPYQ